MVYHAVHHIRPALHYTEIPGSILENKMSLPNKGEIEKPLTAFTILHIFIWLMTKRYDKLAKHVVNDQRYSPAKKK